MKTDLSPLAIASKKRKDAWRNTLKGLEKRQETVVGPSYVFNEHKESVNRVITTFIIPASGLISKIQVHIEDLALIVGKEVPITYQLLVQREGLTISTEAQSKEIFLSVASDIEVQEGDIITLQIPNIEDAKRVKNISVVSVVDTSRTDYVAIGE